MCWFLLTNLNGFFFTVCECVLGEKFAMSSARIGLRGLYCFFFIEFHL